MGRDANTCGKLYKISQLHVVWIASVCQHWAQTCSRDGRISINGLILKQNAVDTARKVWTVVAGNEPVDVH
jgi:hypothetical protein